MASPETAGLAGRRFVERLSVLIPCYNAEAYVAESIDSVLRQTRPPDEVIVVDDGSHDGSAAAVSRFGDRVRLIRQPNGGTASARNTGLAAATGTLVAFLDADDGWPGDSLAQRLAVMEASGAELVFGRVRQCLSEVGPSAMALGEDLAGRLAGSMLVRREVFERVGLFEVGLRETSEIDWVARARDAGVREADCDALVLYRRNHPANMMRVTPSADGAYLEVLRKVLARRRAAVQ